MSLKRRQVVLDGFYECDEVLRHYEDPVTPMIESSQTVVSRRPRRQWTP
jgi:hypothetical protein